MNHFEMLPTDIEVYFSSARRNKWINDNEIVNNVKEMIRLGQISSREAHLQRK